MHTRIVTANDFHMTTLNVVTTKEVTERVDSKGNWLGNQTVLY